MKSFSKLRKEACWTGYKAVGTKKKGDKVVPNCVPEEVEVNEITQKLAGNYLTKVTKQQLSKHGMQPDMYGKLSKNRQQGVSNAFKRLEIDKEGKPAHHLVTKEEISQKEVDNFHKKLDKLVHHTFGKSSKEKKMKEDVEQIQEIGDTEAGREKLKSYRQKANLQKTYTMMRPSASDALKDRQWKNRNIGTSQATKRLGEDGIAVPGPTNTTGSGQVAGMGQPPGSKSGEPGVHPMRKKKVVLLPMGRRSPPKI